VTTGEAGTDIPHDRSTRHPPSALLDARAVESANASQPLDCNQAVPPKPPDHPADGFDGETDELFDLGS
jgi:hypothetical protein